mmetsp:Transcript_550/g.1303  ORF Transcript_550/g.1303 Transcript_550/m.1303 type:complete len:372 (-) Transcript_550:26-1141(-)
MQPRTLIIATLVTVLSATVAVKISNLEVRKDVNGNLMDTHDGNIMQWEAGGDYYYYSMGYQDCELEHVKIPPQECPGIYKPFGTCGFRDDHALRIYSSPDLAQWSLVAEDALPAGKPYGIYFRPKVIKNPTTGLYVLWVNHLPNASRPLVAYPDAVYLVATSPTPAGPFTTVNLAANIEVSGAGDFDIMVDGDEAYLAYDAWGNNHQVIVEQLTDDFTDSLGALASTGPISPKGNEAPVMFKREGYYYLFYGATCCFCRMGSGAELWTSTHPLGPWEATGTDLNPLAMPKHIHTQNHTIRSQNSFTFKVPMKDGTVAIVFAGDLWSSAADNLKSHDLQYWQTLEFDDKGVDNVAPAISPFVFQDSITLDLL